MAHIVWSDDLNTGIPVIDKQHRRIVEYINNLDDVVKTHNRTQLGIVLQELVDYTLSHFGFEESLMEDASYVFINGHKRVHELFAKRVASYQQRFNLGDDISEELLSVLKLWLVNHIKSDDKDYAPAVKDHIHINSNDGIIGRSLKKLFG
jgi:hemerythrin